MVITGSRIRNRDLISPSPITTISADQFTLRGAVGVEELLSELPQTIPGFGQSTSSVGEVSRGVATVDLRGLGPTRTLVTVNGRRWMGADVFGTSDLNTIPPALLQSVEVVTGGASAVYGSDAIAGVVNFQLKRDFEGVELSTQYDITEQGDGERRTVNLTLGTGLGDGRGNITTFFSYTDRESMKGDARNFSSFALRDDLSNTNPRDKFGRGAGLSAGGSPSINSGNVRFAPDVSEALGFGGSIFTFNNNGQAVAFNDPEDRYNFAPENYIQTPLERWQIHTSGYFEVAPDHEVYFEGTFVDSTVNTIRAPTPFSPNNLVLNPNSVFFAPEVQDVFNEFAGEDGLFVMPGLTRRMSDLGPRALGNKRTSYRALFGMEGKINDTWRYDINYQFSRMDGQRLQDNGLLASRFRQAVLTNDAGTACLDASNGCVPLNVFGPDVASTEGLDWIRGRGTNTFSWEQQVILGSVTGDLGNWLGAGDVGVVFGGEWRKQSAVFRPDVVLASGDLENFRAAQPTAGEFDVWEVFSELVVPLLKDAPMVQSLEASLGARYSDYSTAGGVWAYSGGFSLQPVDDVLFRAQYQRAVRAPNVGELFRGDAIAIPQLAFPCSDRTPNPDATLIATCEAIGVPQGQVGQFAQVNDQITVLTGGNPNLVEEESDTWTIGAVFTPTALPGFSASIDYYNITLDNAISELGGSGQGILDFCFAGGDPTSPFCQAIRLFPRGLEIEEIRSQDANIASLETSGIDIAVSYGFDLGFGLFSDVSTLDINLMATHVLKNESTPALFPNNPELEVTNDCVGLYGTTCGAPDPEWRMNVRSTWNTGPLLLSLNWRWLDSVRDDRVVLGGRDPATLPVTKLASEQNTWPATYDIIGRRYFLSANVRL